MSKNIFGKDKVVFEEDSQSRKIIEGDGFYASFPYDGKIPHKPNETKSERAMSILSELEEVESIRLMKEGLQKKGIGTTRTTQNKATGKAI